MGKSTSVCPISQLLPNSSLGNGQPQVLHKGLSDTRGLTPSFLAPRAYILGFATRSLTLRLATLTAFVHQDCQPWLNSLGLSAPSQLRHHFTTTTLSFILLQAQTSNSVMAPLGFVHPWDSLWLSSPILLHPGLPTPGFITHTFTQNACCRGLSTKLLILLGHYLTGFIPQTEPKPG